MNHMVWMYRSGRLTNADWEMIKSKLKVRMLKVVDEARGQGVIHGTIIIGSKYKAFFAHLLKTNAGEEKLIKWSDMCDQDDQTHTVNKEIADAWGSFKFDPSRCSKVETQMAASILFTEHQYE